MDPATLLASVAAIAALVGLSVWLGQWQTRSLDSESQARSLFGQDKPDVAVAETYLSSDGRAALFVLDGDTPGAVGVLRVVGDKVASREVNAANLAGIRERLPDGNGKWRIRVLLRDTTCHRIDIEFTDADRFSLWKKRLAALRARDRSAVRTRMPGKAAPARDPAEQHAGDRA